jgi:peptide/nickel transport system substrate-binding protein
VLGRRAAAASLAVVAIAAAGCGSSGDGSVAAGGEPGPRGAMTIAIAAAPRQADPLLARTPVDRLVDRQLYEPLVETLSGPYDDVRRRPGLALSVRPAEGGTLWRVRLRSGVRFQDGSPLDASAVVANAERWRTTAAGRALVPGLVAADAPRPDLVRLIGDHPLPGLRRRLASPRLGIVSPRELRPRSGSSAALVRPADAGTGAFELRRAGGPNLVLARNTRWWGTAHGLGPALDEVELRVAPSPSERLRLLRRGEVEAAWGLPGPVAARLRRDPLLTGIAAPAGQSVGLERSVRGIDSAAVPPRLSAVWLTTIGAG